MLIPTTSKITPSTSVVDVTGIDIPLANVYEDTLQKEKYVKNLGYWVVSKLCPVYMPRAIVPTSSSCTFLLL